MGSIKTKRPTDVLDYRQDWWPWLTEAGNDTIDTATAVTSPTDLVVDSVDTTATNVTVWLSGGTAGGSYNVAVTIQTNGGRTKTRSFTVNVVAVPPS